MITSVVLFIVKRQETDVISASICYLYCGPLLGLILYAFLLCRYGICGTALYWLNSPSFIGPAEHYGSLVALKELRRIRPEISPLGMVFGLLHGFFASLLAGVLLGGFMAVGFFLLLGYKVQ